MKPVLFQAMAAAALLVCITAAADAKIVGKEVEYRSGDTVLKGYMVRNESMVGKRPGVLVVHEWWGHNDYARHRAKMLAKLGYVALAVDMYGDGKTADHPDDAGRFSSAVMKDFPVAKERFNAALEFLKKQPKVDGKRIAAIGYCFGGGIVLNMARQGVDLKGVASFHGSLQAVEPAQAGRVKAKIRVYNGADDTFVSAESIEAFKNEMKDARADYKFISLPGAVHSFTNPGATEIGKKFGLPLAYNAKADKRSWEDMKKFLESIFKKK